MGIFSSIKNAIFGRKDDETPATAPSGGSSFRNRRSP